MYPDCINIRTHLNIPYPQRGTYENWWSAIFPLIAYTVGLGNLWKFPNLFFQHQGATFLIPYCIALFCIGIPLYFLELALGQYVSLSPTQLFTFMCPITSGVGYGMMFLLFLTVISYNMIIARTIFYMGASLTFRTDLPWAECLNMTYKADCTVPVERLKASEDYYNNKVLNTPNGKDDDVHELMIVCLMSAWLIVAVCLSSGIRGTKNVLIFTVIYPYIMMTLILAWYHDNNDQEDNNHKFLTINTTYLLDEPRIWSDAASQVIYSLGVAFGGVSTIASYNKFKQNILRDVIIVCLLDTLTAIFCSYVIFSLSKTLTEEYLGNEGRSSDLVFIVFPAVVSQMGIGGIWALLFFMMIFTLGFDSLLLMVETLTTSLFDEFHFLRRRFIPVVFIFCLLLACLTIPMTTQGGQQSFDLLNKYTNTHSLFLLGLIEVISVSYFYGFKRIIVWIQNDLKIWVPAPLYFYWAVTWMFLTPASLLVLVGFSVYNEYQEVWKGKVDFNFQCVISLIISFSGFGIVFLRFIYILIKHLREYGFKREHLSKLWEAKSNFCPAYIRVGRDPNTKNYSLREGVISMEGLSSSMQYIENGSAQSEHRF